MNMDLLILNAFYHQPYVLISTYKLLLLWQVDQTVHQYHHQKGMYGHTLVLRLFLSIYLFHLLRHHQKLELHIFRQDFVQPNPILFHKFDQYSSLMEHLVDLIQYLLGYRSLKMAFPLHELF